MKKQSAQRLTTWQIMLVTLGTVLVFGPTAWDWIVALFRNVLDIELDDIFSRGGMFVVGGVLLLIVGIYEFVKDARDKPTSKYIK